MGLTRLLLCGDVHGAFPLLARLAKQIQQKQGPFDALVCCGSFFGPLPSHTTSLQVKSEGDGEHSLKSGEDASSPDKPNGLSPQSSCDGGTRSLSETEESDQGRALCEAVRKTYPEKFNELCSVCESFPFPVFLVDGDISSLLSDSSRSPRDPASSLRSPTTHAEELQGYSAVKASIKQEDTTRLAPQKACASTPPGDTNNEDHAGHVSSEATTQPASRALREERLPGGDSSSPIRICTNVAWLGSAGLTKIAGLKIAFFAVPEEAPWKDDKPATEGEGHSRRDELQSTGELPRDSEPQEKEKEDGKEVASNAGRVFSGTGERAEGSQGDVEAEEAGSAKRRRLGFRTPEEQEEQSGEVAFSEEERGVESSDRQCLSATADTSVWPTGSSIETSNGPRDSSLARDEASHSSAGLLKRGRLAKTALARLVSQANEREWRGRIDVFISCLWPLGVTRKETEKKSSLPQGESSEVLQDFSALLEKVRKSPEDLHLKR